MSLLRKVRFRFRFLFERIWLPPMWLRFSLPVPVLLKRLAAHRLVFIFGIGFRLSTRWLYWFCGFSLQKSEESRGLLRGSLALFLGKLG